MPESHEKKHILLMDDDEDDFLILRDIMETYFPAIRLTYLYGGGRIDKSIFDHVDLVFLDINMPGRNGFEYLDLIRRQFNLTTLPVIIYTNSFSTRDITIAYQKGANLFVNKPMSFETVRVLINEILSIDWTKIDELTRQNLESKKILKYW